MHEKEAAAAAAADDNGCARGQEAIFVACSALLSALIDLGTIWA